MKPRPEMIYRIEQRCDTCSYHNSTTQWLNRPPKWQGSSVIEVERTLRQDQPPHNVTVRHLEGTILWEEELSL